MTMGGQFYFTIYSLWAHSWKGSEDFQYDTMLCEIYADFIVSREYPEKPQEPPSYRFEFEEYDYGFLGRGYKGRITPIPEYRDPYSAAAKGFSRGWRRSKVYSECMENFGWRRVKVE